MTNAHQDQTTLARADGADQDVRVLRLRRAGMFSNVNEVVQQAHLARRGGYRFAIDWSASCYRDAARPGDPWRYYFQPVFPGVTDAPAGAPVLPGGEAVACTRDNIITPRLQDGRCDPLLLPADRSLAAGVVAATIRLHPDVAAQVDAFWGRHCQGPMIALHLRGAGRNHGGTTRLRSAAGAPEDVPFDLYFQAVETALAARPGARILLCSDSQRVVDVAQGHFGDRLIVYPAQRSDFGEMHARHPQNAGQQFDPYRLGLDIVVEAHLMARCDCFVHGNSNVANFVLCKNPHLPAHYVYADFAHDPDARTAGLEN